MNIYGSGLLIGRRTPWAVRGRQARRLQHPSMQHQTAAVLIQSSTHSLLLRLLFAKLFYFRVRGGNTKKGGRSLFFHSVYPFQRPSHTSCSPMRYREPWCSGCLRVSGASVPATNIPCITYEYQGISKNRTQGLCHYCMPKYHGLTKSRAASSCHQL